MCWIYSSCCKNIENMWQIAIAQRDWSPAVLALCTISILMEHFVNWWKTKWFCISISIQKCLVKIRVPVADCSITLLQTGECLVMATPMAHLFCSQQTHIPSRLCADQWRGMKCFGNIVCKPSNQKASWGVLSLVSKIYLAEIRVGAVTEHYTGLTKPMPNETGRRYLKGRCWKGSGIVTEIAWLAGSRLYIFDSENNRIHLI